ncbi:MAG: YiiD C-terminal domain-containing protein [Pseudomonadales bacterium]
MSASNGADALAARCRALEARWHREIPISAEMGVGVAGFDGTTLQVHAALAPNVNVHGTVFGGSLFSVAALCGWGQVYLQLQQQGLDASILFVGGSIRCLAPARDDMQADCIWTADAGNALATLPEAGRCRVHLSVAVDSGRARAAEFEGEYALRLTPAQKSS